MFFYIFIQQCAHISQVEMQPVTGKNSMILGTKKICTPFTDEPGLSLSAFTKM
jgi:hypothetical protein